MLNIIVVGGKIIGRFDINRYIIDKFVISWYYYYYWFDDKHVDIARAFYQPILLDVICVKFLPSGRQAARWKSQRARRWCKQCRPKQSQRLAGVERQAAAVPAAHKRGSRTAAQF